MGNSETKEATDSGAKPPASEYTVLKDLASNLNAFRKGDVFCDIELIVHEKIFKAHRLILAASSPYFKAMFTSRFAEANQRIIRLRGVTSNMMPEIINFIYSGKIEITEECVKELLQDAHHLQILALIDACYQFLERNMAVHNCITTYGLADMYSNLDLKTKAEDFILVNFPAVSETAPFLELPPAELIRIIKEDHLQVDTEDVVCKAVFKWLRSDEQSRQPDFADVLRNVRLTFVSTDLLHNIDKTEDIIKMSTECTDLVKKALFSKLLTSEEKEKPRKLFADSDTVKT